VRGERKRAVSLNLDQLWVPMEAQEGPNDDEHEDNALDSPKRAARSLVTRQPHGNAETYEDDRQDDELGHGYGLVHRRDERCRIIVHGRVDWRAPE
jgi:hypothetical protein